MRRSLLPATLALLAACSVDPVDTAITRRTPYASLRAVVATQALPRVDLVSKVADELPGVVPGVTGPAASPFVPVPAGEASLHAAHDGAALAELDGPMTEGGSYTAFVTGGPGAVTLALVPERFDPVAGQALVRIVDATGLADLTISVDREPIPSGLDKPFVWRAVDPNGKAVVAVRDASGTLATFSGVPLATGSFTTLVLLGRPPESPLRLFTLRDEPGTDPTTALLDADGTVKPRARVRILHAAAGTPAVSVAVAGGGTVVESLDFKALSADVELETDATVTFTAGGASVASKALTLDEAKTYTLALVPGASGPQVATWADDRAEKTAPTARLAVSVPGLPGLIDLAKTDGNELLPPTAHAAASAYVEVPAGPLIALGRIALGPQVVPLATISGLAFPADRATTVAVVGSFDLATRTADLEALVIDDRAGAVVARVVPQPLPPP